MIVRGLALAAIALLVSAAGLAGEAVTIALRAAAAVDAPRMTLADVAAITGGPPAALERLGAMDIGAAPGPGAEREVTRDFLALRLQQERAAPQGLTWTGPDRTRVERRATCLAGATIAQAAIGHLRKTLPWPDGGLVIEAPHPPPDLCVPGTFSSFDYTVSVPPGARLLGAVPCSVTVSAKDRVVGRTTVMLRVRVFQQLVMARQRIRGGECLTKDLVHLQRVELTSLTSDALSDLSEALGQEARQDIPPFTAISRSALRPPRVVRRGTLVTLVAQTACLRITARAIAEQDGAVGQWIPARNVDSRKIVYARVRDAETLEVRF